jgi:inosine/guanosine/xanthosine phosphorylase family protein
VFGTIGGTRVVAQRGRFHFYEGHSMATVALPVRVFAALGARVMLATNAAGGVNAAFNVGDIMVIRDQISFPGLAGANPFVGPNPAAAGGGDAFGPRFFPLTTAYTPLLQDLAQRVAAERGLSKCLRGGVYFHDSGPAYETPAEIAMMRALGGDAVGMSTAPEVAAAAHAGMAVLGLSLITNKCRCVGGRRPPCAAVAAPQQPAFSPHPPPPPPQPRPTQSAPARPATRACPPPTRRCSLRARRARWTCRPSSRKSWRASPWRSLPRPCPRRRPLAAWRGGRGCSGC